MRAQVRLLQVQIGALPIKLELISRSQVSASLGSQALDQGLVAGIAGFAVVALFLIAYYRILGLIATVVVTTIVTRTARRALREATDVEGRESGAARPNCR